MAAASETKENSDEKDSVNATESEVSSDNNKIKIDDLKVVDLKHELEKRDLDKNGVKSVLIERLKAAIVEEGGNPEEYQFEVADATKSPVKKNKESVEANGSVDTNDNFALQEEKTDVTLQLSIDDEEAQLNEEESLMEEPKPSDEIASEESTAIKPECDATEKEKDKTSEPITAQAITPTKSPKLSNDDAKVKKVIKSTLQSKSNEGLNTSPKVVKVIGKNEKTKGASVTAAKCLWVTGIPDTTRAADLKALFSKQGKVLGVKIVKNAKQTPSRCYGYVTMATSKDATKAIQNLHRTELNSKIISVERTQNEPSTLLKKAESKLSTASSKKQSIKKEIVSPKKAVSSEVESKTDSKEKDNKEATKTVDGSKTSVEESAKKKDEKTTPSEKVKDKERRSREHREREVRRNLRRPIEFKPRPFRYSERSSFGAFRRPFGRRPFAGRMGFGSSFRPRPGLMALQKMREDRYQHERFRERREAEHRRVDEISRHRYIERKQREEAYRLEREKEKLRIERELLERERLEILRLEREKQRLERERLEREREELRRQAELGRNAKRSFSQVEREPEHLWDERKKSSRYDGRISYHSEASSSSRFEYTRDRASYSREYERHPERYSTQKHVEALPRTEFGDRDSRREVTIRSRDERLLGRSDFKDRDNRHPFSSRERERHSSSRKELPRNDWKHERRVHERIISPSTSGHRRMTYY